MAIFELACRGLPVPKPLHLAHSLHIPSMIKAYKVSVEEDKLVEFEMRLGELTDEERQIILKGCLINYNRVD